MAAVCPACGSDHLRRISGWSVQDGITDKTAEHPTDMDLPPKIACDSCGHNWDIPGHGNGPRRSETAR
jgi:rRNA maturation endonuclease Nob1